MSVLANLVRPWRTTQGRRHRRMSTSSPPPRSEIPLTGRKRGSDLGFYERVLRNMPDYSSLILGTTSPNIRKWKAPSSYLMSRGSLDQVRGLSPSSRLFDETAGFSLLPPRETRGLITSLCLSLMASTRIEVLSLRSTSSTTGFPSFRRLTGIPGLTLWLDTRTPYSCICPLCVTHHVWFGSPL
jgi:hypothetical protein